MHNQPNEQPFDEPGEASAEQGYVFLDGPDGIAISLTPDAAATTGERLMRAAEQARLAPERGR